VSQVVPDADLHETVRALAAQTATAPRDVLVRTKAKALRRAGVDPATGTLDL
jgi:enoyl-CoA hydratase